MNNNSFFFLNARTASVRLVSFLLKKRKAKCNNYRPFTILDSFFRINCNYILKT